MMNTISKETPSKRRERVAGMRTSGMTYAAIAVQLGVSPSRARSICEHHFRILRRNEFDKEMREESFNENKIDDAKERKISFSLKVLAILESIASSPVEFVRN